MNALKNKPIKEIEKRRGYLTSNPWTCRIHRQRVIPRMAGIPAERMAAASQVGSIL
jgi:hypothetical protein